MKRKFDEISSSVVNQGIKLFIISSSILEELEAGGLYGHEQKRRKLENQKIGDFIVKAKLAVHFRLTSDLNKLEDEH
jgi:hypothetical protein